MEKERKEFKEMQAKCHEISQGLYELAQKDFTEDVFRDAIAHGWYITVNPDHDFGSLLPPSNFSCVKDDWGGGGMTVKMFNMEFDVERYVLDPDVRRTGTTPQATEFERKRQEREEEKAKNKKRKKQEKKSKE